MERNTYIDNIDVEEAKVLYFEKLNIKPEFHLITIRVELGPEQQKI